MRAIGVTWLLAAATLALPAHGAPITTDVSTIRRDGRTIVIGTVHTSASGIQVDVDTVLRGPVKPGAMVVRPSPDGQVTIDRERAVAFIDGGGALRWVGRLIAGPTLEDGVIGLHGFYNYNAHYVQPATMSLDGLRGLLRGGKLHQSFEATLAFPDGRGGLRRTAKRFALQHDAISAATQVTGLATPCFAPPNLDADFRGFRVSFWVGCRSPVAAPLRFLELHGTYTGLATNGAIQVDVTPTQPFLYEHEYDTFIADPALVDVVRVVRVGLADGPAWMWRVGVGLVDPPGKMRAPGRYSTSGPDAPAGTNLQHMYEFGDVKITLSPADGPISIGGEPRGVVSLVESGKLTSCVFSWAGRPDAPCTLQHVAPVFVRR